MPELVPFAVDRTDVTPYYEALAAALAGQGPALAPYPVGGDAPDVPRHPDGAPENLALVVATSGSTGTPKRAMLTRDALLASALATHERIGGPGTWLLPLPPEHIAGTQVLVRSIVAGTTPIVMPSWSVEQFVKASALVARNAPPFSPTHTSLVPTQLRDVLADDAALQAARRFRSILVGGASTPPELQSAACDAGLAIRTTYGSSETSGGCVYDGRPLAGVEVLFVDGPDSTSGRIALTGPTIASGYLDDPDRTAEHFRDINGRRAFVTDDLGHVDVDQTGQHTGVQLRVDGRIDDVIVSGGYKIAPSVVEAAVRQAAGVQDVVCVGLTDARWGQTVGVAVVPDGSNRAQMPDAPELAHRVLDVCRGTLPPYAVPRRIAIFENLPVRGIGKPDRGAIAAHDDWRSLDSADEKPTS